MDRSCISKSKRSKKVKDYEYYCYCEVCNKEMLCNNVARHIKNPVH